MKNWRNIGSSELENYRGKKYGSILMKRVLSFDPEILRTVSWISEKNHNVIQAHKQLGFKEDGLTNPVELLPAETTVSEAHPGLFST